MSKGRIPGATLSALSIAFPSLLRTNGFFRRRYPDMVARAEAFSLAKLWSHDPRARASVFDVAMAPYASDPFRGAVERRLRATGETALSMELRAADGALAARGLRVDDIDLLLVSSFVGDRIGVGNAAYLAAELGVRAPAWNFETACAGSVAGLVMASSLVASRSFERILLVVSTSNSVQVEASDTIGFFLGDGAAALFVERSSDDTGILGHHTLNSVGTNDMFVIRSVPDGMGGTRLVTAASPDAARMARETAEPYLRETVQRALEGAGLSAGDVDHWVFNTPNAWYADFCARTLGVAEGRHSSIYPRYANIGAVLAPATLYHALHEGQVRPGSIVALYAIGSSSTASCVVMRTGPIALGPFPARPTVDDADEAASSAPTVPPPDSQPRRTQ